jgi:hypothetical protein
MWTGPPVARRYCSKASTSRRCTRMTWLLIEICWLPLVRNSTNRKCSDACPPLAAHHRRADSVSGSGAFHPQYQDLGRHLRLGRQPRLIDEGLIEVAGPSQVAGAADQEDVATTPEPRSVTWLDVAEMHVSLASPTTGAVEHHQAHTRLVMGGGQHVGCLGHAEALALTDSKQAVDVSGGPRLGRQYCHDLLGHVLLPFTHCLLYVAARSVWSALFSDCRPGVPFGHLKILGAAKPDTKSHHHDPKNPELDRRFFSANLANVSHR